jgi:hypothetical protein
MMPLRRATELLATFIAGALLALASASCQNAPPQTTAMPSPAPPGATGGLSASALVASVSPASSPAVQLPDQPAAPRPARTYKIVHVFVALCDNANQGIIKVPAGVGNGQDAASNLYWGAMYGVKTFFARSHDWTSLEVRTKPAKPVLDRAAFRSKGSGVPVYVLADAYDGAAMPAALTDFLRAAAGLSTTSVAVVDDGQVGLIAAGGQADLVAFVGHNGLMDAPLTDPPANRGGPRPAAAVVLACKSFDFFSAPLSRAGCPPLITTRQLMCPEAYTLDAIVRSWAAGDPPTTVHQRAAAAYATYQKITPKSAAGVFVAGASR